MVKAPDFIPTAESLELPDRMDPSRVGIVDAFVALLISGLGIIILTPAMGIAASVQGLVLALQSLLGGLQDFTVRFVQGFFSPFLTYQRCSGLIENCEVVIAGTQEASLFVQSAGFLGFALGIVVVGGMMYVVAIGVQKGVGAIG